MNARKQQQKQDAQLSRASVIPEVQHIPEQPVLREEGTESKNNWTIAGDTDEEREDTDVDTNSNIDEQANVENDLYIESHTSTLQTSVSDSIDAHIRETHLEGEETLPSSKSSSPPILRIGDTQIIASPKEKAIVGKTWSPTEPVSPSSSRKPGTILDQTFALFGIPPEEVRTKRYEVELIKPLGLVVGEVEDEVIVAAIEAKGNAARSSIPIRVGDKIVQTRTKVSGPILTADNMEALIESLRTKYGEQGSSVIIEFERRSDGVLSESDVEGLEPKDEQVALNNVLRSFLNLKGAGVEPQKTREYLLKSAAEYMHSCASRNDAHHIWKAYKRLEKAQVGLDNKFYNTMMSCLLDAGDAKGAVDIFKSIPKPNIQCFTSLIKAYSAVDQLDMASSVLKDIRSAGLKPTVRTYNTLISSFVAKRKLDFATHVFEEMEFDGVKPDTISWNIILNWYASNTKGNSRSRKVEETFEHMIESNVQPNLITYTTLLKAYLAYDDFESGKQLLERMKLDGFSPDTEVYNTFINAYARRKNWTEAYSMYQTMKEEKVPMNLYTYSRVIRALATSNQASRAENVLASMREAGVTPNAVVYVTLLSMYADRGNLQKVLFLLREMQNDHIAADNRVMSSVMHACLRTNNPDLAISLYSKMKSSGISPDVVTCTLLLRAHALKANFEKALELLNIMRKSKHRMQRPEVVAYNSLIELATLHQRGDIALETLVLLMKDKDVRPDRNTMESITHYWPKLHSHSKEVVGGNESEREREREREGEGEGEGEATHSIDQVTIQASRRAYLDFLQEARKILRKYHAFPNGQLYIAILRTCIELKDANAAREVLQERRSQFKMASRDLQLADETDRRARSMFSISEPSSISNADSHDSNRSSRNNSPSSSSSSTQTA